MQKLCIFINFFYLRFDIFYIQHYKTKRLTYINLDVTECFKRDRIRLNKQRVLFAFDMSLNATGLNPNSFCVFV